MIISDVDGPQTRLNHPPQSRLSHLFGPKLPLSKVESGLSDLRRGNIGLLVRIGDDLHDRMALCELRQLCAGHSEGMVNDHPGLLVVPFTVEREVSILITPDCGIPGGVMIARDESNIVPPNGFVAST